MNKIDELFKEKLTNHSITPSVGAWDKVEANLSKKNRGIIWLRWAAIFLLGTLMLGLFLINSRETPLIISEKKEAPVIKDQNKSEQTTRSLANDEEKVKNVVSQNKNKGTATRRTVQPVIAKEEKEEVAEVVKEIPEEAVIQNTETTVASMTPVTTQNEKAAKSIVLVYTLETIEPTHETPHTELASNDKKEPSLKRVMKFAKDVKNGDAPLGGLRVVKEDLFALELKKKPTSKKQ